jgi:LPPG:FO 2-phospho-L-lactate transferase
MARGLSRALPAAHFSVIVNVGDDDVIYGVLVSADVDTVTYTLAGIEGPQGWGIAGDTFTVVDQLARVGVDTTFRLGDRDLAICMYRTQELARGRSLTAVTKAIADHLEIGPAVLPASDDAIRTKVRTEAGKWLSFQEYFVGRRHRDAIVAVEYDGADRADPANAALEAIERSDLVIIAPSNPPLSIWPMLAMPMLRSAIQHKPRVVAVSPLFGGKALKGPAEHVLAGLGLPAGTGGILAAYDGLLTDLVIDQSDAADLERFRGSSVKLHAVDTRIAEPRAAERFAGWLLETMR